MSCWNSQFKKAWNLPCYDYLHHRNRQIKEIKEFFFSPNREFSFSIFINKLPQTHTKVNLSSLTMAERMASKRYCILILGTWEYLMLYDRRGFAIVNNIVDLKIVTLFWIIRLTQSNLLNLKSENFLWLGHGKWDKGRFHRVWKKSLTHYCRFEDEKCHRPGSQWEACRRWLWSWSER